MSRPPLRPAPAAALEPASAEPLYQQLADRLAAEIVDGTLAPGQQLPTEAELVARHAISRATVRQALQLLTRSGQIVSRRGKGSFVARKPLHQDLADLQGFHDALVRQGVEPRTELLEFSAAARRIDDDLPPGLALPVRLRRRYTVDDAPFAVVEAFLPAPAGALGRARAERLTVYDILHQYLGIRIARADVEIRCARPSARVAKELGMAAREAVLRMERTSFDAGGTACEHMRISIVPERYAFRMQVRGPLEIARALSPAATPTSPRRAARAPGASR